VIPHDTAPEAAAVLARLLRATTGVERVRMISDMFDAARRLATAHIQAAGPVDAITLRTRLFLQLHGPDLDERTIVGVVARLAAEDPGRGEAPSVPRAVPRP
jgi:hypothetical protein